MTEPQEWMRVTKNEVKPDRVGDNSIQRTSCNEYLRKQSCKDYNHKDCDVSNITEETQDDEIVLLKFNSDSFKITEDKFDETDAEYIS